MVVPCSIPSPPRPAPSAVPRANPRPKPSSPPRTAVRASALMSHLLSQLDPLQLGHLPPWALESCAGCCLPLPPPAFGFDGFGDVPPPKRSLSAGEDRAALPLAGLGAGGGVGGSIMLQEHLLMQGGPRCGYLGSVTCAAEGSETQLCRFYLHIPLAGAKCTSRKAIFQLFPFIKVSFAKIFPFEEPKNVKDF